MKRKQSERGSNRVGAKKPNKIRLSDADNEIKKVMRKFGRSLQVLAQQKHTLSAPEMDEE